MPPRSRRSIPVGLMSLIVLVTLVTMLTPPPGGYKMWISVALAVLVLAADVWRYRQGERVLWFARS